MLHDIFLVAPVQIYQGNKDQNSIFFNILTKPIEARVVRLHPYAWHGHISLRMEFYGCSLKAGNREIFVQPLPPQYAIMPSKLHLRIRYWLLVVVWKSIGWYLLVFPYHLVYKHSRTYALSDNTCSVVNPIQREWYTWKIKGFFRTVIVFPSSECAKPLGLENYRIPKSAISASSEVTESSVTCIIIALFKLSLL